MLARKLLKTADYQLLDAAGLILEGLTGENFIPVVFGTIELDRYSEKLNIAIEFVDDAIYEIPAHYHELYTNPIIYDDMINDINFIRSILCTSYKIAIIPLPRMRRDRLRGYLSKELHRLTAYRVWVGSPKYL